MMATVFHFRGLNYADAEDLARIVPAAVEAFGDLTICINCAGVAQVVDFLTLERGEFERVLAINLTAPFQLGLPAAYTCAVIRCPKT
jgi:NAD(P)-dependent dehydrogenase (short-subunit alcohol dehydrogenase family)